VFCGRERLWQGTQLLRIAADTVTIVGLLIPLWARWMLGTNWSANVVFKERHELIEGGPYRFVRHPIYSGVLLMLFGTMLVWGRLVGVFPLIVFIAGLSVKGVLKKRFLISHFPHSTPHIQQQVTPAVLPFLLSLHSFATLPPLP